MTDTGDGVETGTSGGTSDGGKDPFGVACQRAAAGKGWGRTGGNDCWGIGGGTGGDVCSGVLDKGLDGGMVPFTLLASRSPDRSPADS